MNEMKGTYFACRHSSPSPCALAAMLILSVLVNSSVAFAAGGPSHPQREILDPCLGSRWQFQVDLVHPERPARLVRIDSTALPSNEARQTPVIAIRAGDQIAVERDTAFVHVRLQAVAIESAVAGEVLRVRLYTGRAALPATGAMIRVLAVAPGEGRWLTSERRGQ
jgi:hypothetical protein